MPHQLTPAEARRIAVRAQLLAAPRPTDLVAVVQRLTLVQIDPTAAVAPSADLVLWSRLGSAYRPEHLQEAVAISGRVGRQRLWDLPGRVYPDLPPVTVPEAERRRNERRLSALGIARARGPVMPVEPVGVGEAGEPAVVEGVAGEWRVDPAQLGRPFTGRTALLSPFDRLVHDRVRLQELFGFEYGLEMYKPKAQRRWGYFALPVLHSDRLVGKVDATADRKRGVLDVHAIHEDMPFTATIAKAVQRELDDLAGWLGLVRS